MTSFVYQDPVHVLYILNLCARISSVQLPLPSTAITANSFAEFSDENVYSKFVKYMIENQFAGVQEIGRKRSAAQLGFLHIEVKTEIQCESPFRFSRF